MKKYNNYKDSGIEWIGEIPEHWEAVPMRFLLRQRITDGPHETPKFLPNGIPFLSVDGIQDGELVFEGCRKISKEDHEKYKEKCVVEKHDILMGKAASVGKVAQVKVDFEFSIWSPLALLKPNHDKITSAYFEYFLKSKYAKDNANILSTFNTQQNISMTDIPRIYYVIPNSVEEQTAIANYLDRKTAEIDELIADKKRLLELYEEEKTAIINQAVTKGLPAKAAARAGINPDAPMKDSGIEWLGEIPEHWEVKQFRHCITILTDFTANGSFASLAANVNYLSSGYSRLVRLTDLRVNLSNEGIYVDEHAHNFLSKSELFGGEILLANVGAYAGLVIQMPYFEGKFTLGPNMFLIRVNQNSDYMNFMLNSAPVNSNLRNIALSSAQPKLNKDDIKGLRLVLPPIHEQDLIVNWLNIECARIDAKKAKTEKLIELLTEYRTALISEVVTGKIKVID